MESNNAPAAKLDVYALVTNRIIELLERGTAPWQLPWTHGGLPMNLLTKRPYRGINLWLLLSIGYEQNLFLTWDQLKSINGSVKRGEKGHIVVFYKTLKKHAELDEEEKERSIPLLRYYKVFNVEQCTGIPAHLLPEIKHETINPIFACEKIVAQMQQCPPIKHEKQQAFYDPARDYVNMPKRRSFKSSESYYGTLFHELVHSTGHEKRLKRKTITEMAEFGSEPYSLEELIAEIGTCYLCSHVGILAKEEANSAAYIQGWLKKFKNDKRFVIYASSYAQRATDYILNVQVEEQSNGQVEESHAV
jgi:antirestriction protein ArdC